MASFRKTRGNYYARFYDRTRSPERKTWPLRTSRQDVARRRLTELEAAYEAGDFDPWKGGWLREQVTAAEGVARFLDAKEGSVRPRTLGTYRQQLEAMLGTLPRGGDFDLGDVTGADLRRYVHAPGVSSATRRKRYRHVRAFLNWAEGEGLLDASPLDDLDTPTKETKEAAFLKPVDVERLCIAIEHHMDTTADVAGRTPDLAWLRDLVLVAVATGLRRGELLNLRWADVDLADDESAHAGSLLVRHRDDFKTKGGAERRVPLVGDALDTLRRMWRDRIAGAEREGSLDGPVFVDRRGLPVKPNRVTHRFKDMARLAGLDERIHFHSLRHTCASWLAMKGVPMRVIQAVMGHSSVSVTERYSHLAPETLDAAMREAFE